MATLNQINPNLPDATFDLDGTVFKMTVLETYTEWLCQQGLFDPLPSEIKSLKEVWKRSNTEENYVTHLCALVQFFIKQVPGKEVNDLIAAAHIVASQQNYRRWDATIAIINHLKRTHNLIAISLMPEWLMEPFTKDLHFKARIGSTYVTQDGRFTDKAHSINKAEEYAKLRNGDTSKLDIHMGDTVGDSSLLSLARRPILFNPSFTLLAGDGTNATIITNHKDVVTVMNSDNNASHKVATIWGPPLDTAALLKSVATKS